MSAPRARARVRAWGERLAPWGTRRRTLAQIPSRIARAVRERGLLRSLVRTLAVWRWLPALFRPALAEHGLPVEEYETWVRLRERLQPPADALRRRVEDLPRRPLISVVMPVHETPPDRLRTAAGSVAAQVYPEWELCVADDGSSRLETREALRDLEGSDGRIRVVRTEERRGTVGAAAAALDLASGELVAVLHHDDELKPTALLEVAALLNERPSLDLIYTDQDTRAPDGRLGSPFLKPDWSPDLLMSVNYLGRLTVYRRALIDRIGGLRDGFDGAEGYDLALRASEATKHIAHLAEPLSTSREIPGPEAAAIDAGEGARRALRDAIRRRGYEGRVEDGPAPGRFSVRYAVPGSPRVTIVIPTRDRVDLLRTCIESIRARTSDDRYELLVVDNDSREPETLAYLRSVPGRVFPFPGPFNYAEMMNAASEAAGDTDLILFLNNDTRVESPGWLEAMMEHGQRPEVGVVGARLLYPDGRPQHEGIIVGFAGGPANNVDFGGFDDMGETIRNCSAVTFACALVRPEVYRELGGLETRLSVAYNDVDFCLRAREKGYEIVYTPHARLVHHERATRRQAPHLDDEAFFRERWGDYRDPYYNPNFHPIHPFRLRVDA